jgi:hypothetical protein
MKTVRVGFCVSWLECTAQLTALYISLDSYSGLATEYPGPLGRVCVMMGPK